MYLTHYELGPEKNGDSTSLISFYGALVFLLSPTKALFFNLFLFVMFTDVVSESRIVSQDKILFSLTQRNNRTHYQFFVLQIHNHQIIWSVVRLIQRYWHWTTCKRGFLHQNHGRHSDQVAAVRSIGGKRRRKERECMEGEKGQVLATM